MGAGRASETFISGFTRNGKPLVPAEIISPLASSNWNAAPLWSARQWVSLVVVITNPFKITPMGVTGKIF